MTKKFEDSIAEIVAAKQQKSQATEDVAKAARADLAAKRIELADVIKHWDKIIAPTVAELVAVANEKFKAIGVTFAIKSALSHTTGANVVIAQTPSIGVSLVSLNTPPRPGSSPKPAQFSQHISFVCDQSGHLRVARNPPSVPSVPSIAVKEVTEEQLAELLESFMRAVVT
jgi:hypothetical protein